ncbi:deoxynucleoside kinase [Nodularia sphaerocarpa]|uniref:deoxynucleoside kinase n=1 Tax=Nodularia sphaerocarpa TaxID=137816 RepID=UPI00232BCE1F|nr:deoxynucleoside kinase [Nodularia sphaerocarpa]MDB9372321.1 deoxynucleoside kinase [Nodularia sphaerocarpa CS-585]MDB9377937.1 deoxynucleoside kinase [Nodularia sphaerocarpa CS-585A2]
MTKFTFLAFEGLDGAGKTTLAQLFAKQQNFDYYGSIPPELICLREQIAATNSPISTFHFYSLCNILRSYEYRLKLNDLGVVADRYVFSTLAYHSLLMKQDLSSYLHILQSEQKFLMPDVIVYVTASESTINQRITKRSQNVPMQWYGDKVSLEYNLDESYKRIFSLVNIPIIQIDTTNSNPEQAYSNLCCELYKIKDTIPILKTINFNID